VTKIIARQLVDPTLPDRLFQQPQIFVVIDLRPVFQVLIRRVLVAGVDIDQALDRPVEPRH
jgi:hypothetical protein